MRTTLNVLSLSAGKIDDGGLLYASFTVLDEAQANQVDQDRIDVGQKHAKIKIITDGENKLARSLAVSGLIPGEITVTLGQTVKKGEVALIVESFEPLPAAKRA